MNALNLPQPLARRRWLSSLGLLPLLQACSPLGIINATVPSSTHRLLTDQAYGPDPRQRMDVYLPRDAGPKAPLVLFFYGGSWTSGNKADYAFVGEALAAEGIIAVVADYRLSPKVHYPAFIEDSAAAFKWTLDVANRLGADTDRYFVMGHSAGAYNAAMLALDPRWLSDVALRPERIAGWIGLAGPYDFLPIGVPEVKTAFRWPHTPAESQPLYHAERLAKGSAPPTLLLAARHDDLVDPRRNTGALARALIDNGNPVELELYDRVSHSTLIGSLARPLRPLAPVLERVVKFVNTHST